jgi:hypothetical protein
MSSLRTLLEQPSHDTLNSALRAIQESWSSKEVKDKIPANMASLLVKCVESERSVPKWWFILMWASYCPSYSFKMMRNESPAIRAETRRMLYDRTDDYMQGFPIDGKATGMDCLVLEFKRDFLRL